MPEKYQCPGCQQFKDISMFTARPVDERCDVCLPVDQAMVAMDKKVQLAGNKWRPSSTSREKGQVAGSRRANDCRPDTKQLGGEQQFMLMWVSA
jgi:hypothetical protein